MYNKTFTMAQYAITYAPNYNGGAAPANTANTGSFYIGALSAGPWNQVVPQSTTNTLFCASPNDTAAYIIALPNPNPSPASPWSGLDAPQFWQSVNPLTGAPQKNDAAFINICDHILKNYGADGDPTSPPINVGGCSTVSQCQQLIDTAGWQSYNWLAP